MSKSNEHSLILADNMKALESIMPAHMNAKRLCRLAMTCISRNPELLKCTPSSFFLAVATCAELGLEPGVLQHVAIVPYGKVAQVIPMYQGLIHLGRQTGELKQIYSVLVREGDIFEYCMGLNPDLTHTPVADSSVPWRHVYSVAKLVDNIVQFEVMDRAQVMKIKAQAASQKGPWLTHEDEMVRKTPVKRLMKMLPKSPALAQAIDMDDRAEVGKPQVPAGLDLDSLKHIDIPLEEPDVEPVKQPTRKSEKGKKKEIISMCGEEGKTSPPEIDSEQDHVCDGDPPEFGEDKPKSKGDLVMEIIIMQDELPAGPVKRAFEALGIPLEVDFDSLTEEALVNLHRALKAA